MITQNFTSQPTFFGCDATEGTPLVLYLPNSPWSGYSNFTYRKSSFTGEQLNDTLENAFQLATYGNGTTDADWPACLACATIRGSMKRMNMTLPDQCSGCFDRHCWNGKNSSDKVTQEDLDLRPRLSPGLSYETWNATVWEATNSNGTDSRPTEKDGETTDAAARLRSPITALACVLLTALLLT